MGRDTLTVVADAVLQHIRDAGSAIREESFLVSLPTYLDATEVHLLQMEVNRRSVSYVELQHRPRRAAGGRAARSPPTPSVMVDRSTLSHVIA